LQKWLEMVFIPLLGFGGSFEAFVLSSFTIVPWCSKRAKCSLNVLWKNPASRRICHSSDDAPSLKTANVCPSNKLKLNPKGQKKN
jgi:hypothetical protein